jgi:hypothetical protein
VNKEASRYVRLLGGSKIGNLIFWLPLVFCPGGGATAGTAWRFATVMAVTVVFLLSVATVSTLFSTDTFPLCWQTVMCCDHTRAISLAFGALVWRMRLTKVTHAIAHALNMLNGVENSDVCGGSSILFCYHWLHNSPNRVKVRLWHSRKILKQNVFVEFQILLGIDKFDILLTVYHYVSQ